MRRASARPPADAVTDPPVSRVIAIGPGESELVPAAAIAALRAAGGVRVLEPQLAATVLAAGARIDPASSTLAASDRCAHVQACAWPDAATVPARALLARQAAQQAAGELVELTALLRRECPWDRAQTVLSIVPHTVEEAYEVADAAAEHGPSAKLIDELGDLLFQTTFLALLCDEQGEGDWCGVARGVSEKLRVRHPWVFGVEQAADADDARRRWDHVKVATEGREGIFHDVPGSLPALPLARKLQRRAAAIGFDYDSERAAFADLASELEELRAELEGRSEPVGEHEPERRVADEIGDVLFACVNVARRWNCDPELALRGAAGRFRRRVEGAAELAAGEGVDFAGAGVGAQETYYQRAKAALQGAE